jgi:hypothetical protein
MTTKYLPGRQAKLENAKHDIAADTARVVELLRQAEARRPCEKCLRPASPCKERCLRAMRLNYVEALLAEANAAALKPKRTLH